MSPRPPGGRPDRPGEERSAPRLPPGGGLLLVDKPTGCTSHDVVGRLRHVLRTRRIGHAGTLDPMATGLLVLAVDRSTRLLGHLALTDKTYLATIRLGQQTDTDDADGVIGSSASVEAIADDDIRSGVSALTGSLAQVPSSVSAIKVDGRRAYDLVRSGVPVDLAARPVTVSSFEILDAPRRVLAEAVPVIDLDVEVDCTTGTYVRSLARDLGAALGVGGHLTRLRRTRVGPFHVDAAVDVFGPAGPDDASTGAPTVVRHPATPPTGRSAVSAARSAPRRAPVTEEFAASVANAVIPAALAVRQAFPTRIVDQAQARDLQHGRTVEAAGIAGTYGAFDSAGALIALVTERDGVARSVLGWQPNS